MKIKRSVLEAMVREEFKNFLGGLFEAPKGPDVVDSEKEKKPEEDKKDAKNDAKAGKTDVQAKDQKKPAPKKSAAAGEEKPKDLPVGEDPAADPELEKDVASGEKEDAEDVTGGKIADEVTGKTIQSITMEPKSKTLPGAQEIVITFNDIPDPLKILLTKTGQVKFFMRGLHNTL